MKSQTFGGREAASIGRHSFFDKKVILSVKDNTHGGSNKKLIYFDQPKFLFTTFLLINVIIAMG